MPMETPQGISRRAPPPMCCYSGLPSMRASRSQTAASSPPRAIWCPRMCAAARADFGRALESVIQHARRGIVAQDQPRRFGPLLVVERILAGGDFAPAGNAAARDFDQDDVALGGPAEAGLEEMHQRHPDLAQRDLF